MRLFGDTKLAQFNPASKSFFQLLVFRSLPPGRVLQEPRVTDLQNSQEVALTEQLRCAGCPFRGRRSIFDHFL
jgi:hypothetical protein